MKNYLLIESEDGSRIIILKILSSPKVFWSFSTYQKILSLPPLIQELCDLQLAAWHMVTSPFRSNYPKHPSLRLPKHLNHPISIKGILSLHFFVIFKTLFGPLSGHLWVVGLALFWLLRPISSLSVASSPCKRQEKKMQFQGDF